MTPCFNRPDDLRLVLGDLDRIAHAGLCPDRTDRGSTNRTAHERLSLRVIVVDNGSNPALDRVAVPRDLDVRFERLERNLGGSGGYNHGMRLALEPDPDGVDPEFVWLLDSDARPRPDALAILIDAMDRHPDYALIGSAIADPDTGELFEIGGRVGRLFATYGPAHNPQRPANKEVVAVRYAAACSALVRAGALRQGGPMPDVFLNGDDVEWCIRLQARTGLRIGAARCSIVSHPRFTRIGQTWTRYFGSRNGFGPIDALGWGPRARLARAVRELLRATTQAIIGREDLAGLHLRGLADAAAGRNRARGSLDSLEYEPFHPFEELADTLDRLDASAVGLWLHPGLALEPGIAPVFDRALAEAGVDAEPVRRGSMTRTSWSVWPELPLGLWRLVRGPKRAIAVLPAHALPDAWACGRIQIMVSPGGYVVRRYSRRRVAVSILGMWTRGLVPLARLTLGRHRSAPAER